MLANILIVAVIASAVIFITHQLQLEKTSKRIIAAIAITFFAIYALDNLAAAMGAG